jgi:hypothetical protein
MLEVIGQATGSTQVQKPDGDKRQYQRGTYKKQMYRLKSPVVHPHPHLLLSNLGSIL